MDKLCTGAQKKTATATTNKLLHRLEESFWSHHKLINRADRRPAPLKAKLSRRWVMDGNESCPDCLTERTHTVPKQTIHPPQCGHTALRLLACRRQPAGACTWSHALIGLLTAQTHTYIGGPSTQGTNKWRLRERFNTCAACREAEASPCIQGNKTRLSICFHLYWH